MGGLLNSKSFKSYDDIISDINKINKITNNELFIRKCNYSIKFSYSKNILKRVLIGEQIYLDIVIINNISLKMMCILNVNSYHLINFITSMNV